ncbi:hypothetical protein SISSUDRAFT_458915 [Sistotremastrum suecicum HHB10207 ss-3]|uniref:Uncharacterized protein n=1 Tax=Sistotremastrum suecicum HHB10207 ss-3 TaxID=1314776 RepID=A0A165Y6Z5_9AGAM|nr:hypothetical protein SISSUDRAFT_458915 [Sistotremastrum suecicum HHB10207 ss-3]
MLSGLPLPKPGYLLRLLISSKSPRLKVECCWDGLCVWVVEMWSMNGWLESLRLMPPRPLPVSYAGKVPCIISLSVVLSLVLQSSEKSVPKYFVQELRGSETQVPDICLGSIWEIFIIKFGHSNWHFIV